MRGATHCPAQRDPAVPSNDGSGGRARERSVQDCPAHRSAPEFWSSCRPWSGRWPGSESPFCALSVAMDLDDGGVDHSVFHVRRVGAGLENPGENIRFDPVAVALENSVPVAEQRRKITPRAARPHNPKDRFHEAPVVASAAPGVRRLTQTMRLHLRPLGVRQYESFHPEFESQPSHRWNPDSQQTLTCQRSITTRFSTFTARTSRRCSSPGLCCRRVGARFSQSNRKSWRRSGARRGS